MPVMPETRQRRTVASFLADLQKRYVNEQQKLTEARVVVDDCLKRLVLLQELIDDMEKGGDVE